MNGLLQASAGTRIGAAGVACGMVVWIFADAQPVGQDFPLAAPWDKLAHFTCYGTMAFLLAHAVGRRWIGIPLVLVPAIGALDEWHQASIPGREVSFFDWLADELGAVAFVYAYLRLSCRRRVDLPASRT